jgi:hypothetical protein
MARAMSEYFLHNEEIHPGAERVTFAHSLRWQETAQEVLKILEKK